MSHFSARQCRDVVQVLSIIRSTLQTSRFLSGMGIDVKLIIDGGILLFTVLPMLQRALGISHSEYQIEDNYEAWQEWDIWGRVIPDLENALKCADISETEKLELKEIIALLPKAK